MKRLWINVRAKNEFPHDGKCVAYYGSMKEALGYAYDYLCSPYKTCIVSVFDDEMNKLITCETW